MGIFVLITNADISGEEALRLYREKDGVEKCFDSLKNNHSLKRLRVHSQEALEGLLFIEFLSLILYSAISKVMRESGLHTTLTITEVLFELRKIKNDDQRNIENTTPNPQRLRYFPRLRQPRYNFYRDFRINQSI